MTANGVVAQASQGPYSSLSFTLDKAGLVAKEGDHVFEIVNSDGIGAQKIFTATPMSITSGTKVSSKDKSVTLPVANYREGSSARWQAPGASAPVDVPAADVSRDKTDSKKVVVTLSPGNLTGVGTLTLVAPLGGTAATSVEVTA